MSKNATILPSCHPLLYPMIGFLQPALHHWIWHWEARTCPCTSQSRGRGMDCNVSAVCPNVLQCVFSCPTSFSGHDEEKQNGIRICIFFLYQLLKTAMGQGKGDSHIQVQVLEMWFWGCLTHYYVNPQVWGS